MVILSIKEIINIPLPPTNTYWHLAYTDILTWKPIHIDSLCTESNTHVAISPFTDYLHFKVIKTTGSWDRMCGSDTGSIFMCFAMA